MQNENKFFEAGCRISGISFFLQIVKRGARKNIRRRWEQSYVTFEGAGFELAGCNRANIRFRGERRSMKRIHGETKFIGWDAGDSEYPVVHSIACGFKIFLEVRQVDSCLGNHVTGCKEGNPLAHSIACRLKPFYDVRVLVHV